VFEVAHRQRAVDAPVGCDRRQGGEDEASLLQLRVRDRQPPRAKFSPAPQNEVEVEDPRPPALPRPAAERAFDRLEPAQHRRRLEPAFDQRHGVGEIAAGAALCGVEDDW
jgi:hypothetical protein